MKQLFIFTIFTTFLILSCENNKVKKNQSTSDCSVSEKTSQDSSLIPVQIIDFELIDSDLSDSHQDAKVDLQLN